MVIISIITVVIAGFLMAMQSPTNTTLSRYAGNLEATTISFTGGAVILLVATLIAGSGSFAGLADVSFWELLGGAYGVYTVLMITYSVPVLGVALSITILMLGQVLMGMVIDYFGLLYTTPLPFDLLRTAGCIVFTIGVIIFYIGKKKSETLASKNKASAKTLFIAALLFVSGIGSALQSPTNVSLASHVGQFEAAFVSFASGAVLIFIVTLIIRKGRFSKINTPPEEAGTGIGGTGIKFWMLLGGAYGSFVIFTNVVTTPYLGVTLLMVGLMLGQLTGGMLADTLGLLRTEKIKINPWRIAGLVIILAGVLMITLAKL